MCVCVCACVCIYVCMYVCMYIYIGSEIFINGKIVDDFKILDKNYIHTLNVSATQQLHKTIMQQKNEINDLKTRLARLEAIINSSLTVDEIKNNGTDALQENVIWGGGYMLAYEEDTCLSLIVNGTTSNGTDT